MRREAGWVLIIRGGHDILSSSLHFGVEYRLFSTPIVPSVSGVVSLCADRDERRAFLRVERHLKEGERRDRQKGFYTVDSYRKRRIPNRKESSWPSQ
jgi:hypothetical protein